MSDLQSKMDAFDVTATVTAAALSSDSTFREEVTVLADSANTVVVYVGSTSSKTFPLIAGAWLTIKKTALNLIYCKTASGTGVLHVACGGS